jgi:hypothetical protein
MSDEMRPKNTLDRLALRQDLGRWVAAFLRSFEQQAPIDGQARTAAAARVELAVRNLEQREPDDISLICLDDCLLNSGALPRGDVCYSPPPRSHQLGVLSRFVGGRHPVAPERLLEELARAAAWDWGEWERARVEQAHRERDEARQQVANEDALREEIGQKDELIAQLRGQVDEARGEAAAARQEAEFHKAVADGLPVTNGGSELLEEIVSRKWSVEQVEECLRVLAEENLNSETAAVRLTEAGYELDASTLRRWRTQYPNRLRQLQITVAREAMEAAA